MRRHRRGKVLDKERESLFFGGVGVCMSLRISLVNRVVNISAVRAKCRQLVPFAWQ